MGSFAWRQTVLFRTRRSRSYLPLTMRSSTLRVWETVRAESLEMVGALTSLTVRRHFEIPFEPEAVAAVTADGDQWVRDGMDLLRDDISDESLLGGLIGEMQVVAGLELVADEAWDGEQVSTGRPPTPPGHRHTYRSPHRWTPTLSALPGRLVAEGGAGLFPEDAHSGPRARRRSVEGPAS